MAVLPKRSDSPKGTRHPAYRGDLLFVPSAPGQLWPTAAVAPRTAEHLTPVRHPVDTAAMGLPGGTRNRATDSGGPSGLSIPTHPPEPVVPNRASSPGGSPPSSR